MKRVITIILIVLLLMSSVGFISLDASAEGAFDNTYAETRIIPMTQQEFYNAVAKAEGKSDAEISQTIDNQVSTCAYDEELRYATIEKTGCTITNEQNYTERVTLAVYVSYVYNKAKGKATSFNTFGAPFASIDNPSVYNVNLDVGEYETIKYSNSKYKVTVLGKITYYIEGIDVSIGGDIIGVSGTVGNRRITTDILTISATFTVDDLN